MSIKLSKKLSWLLRHGAVDVGLAMRADGYVKLKELMRTKDFKGTSLNDILLVVRENSKQRFEVTDEDGELLIRATQGHTISSVKEEGLLQKIEHNEIVYCIHGTYKRNVDIIRKKGLSRMRRNHIHLAASIPGIDQVISGMRHDSDVVVVIDLIGARDKGGIDFYLSSNNVILSPGQGKTGIIPPEFIVGIFDKRDYVRETSIGGPSNLPRIELQSEPICTSHAIKPVGVSAAPAALEISDNTDNLFYCVIDFEATCERDKKILNQEIIEFPAVFINAQSMNVEYEFHSYVKPVHNIMLSGFCTELTGIEQATVDSASEFGIVFHQFCSFLEHLGFMTGSGSDSFPAARELIFVTHGDWDLRTMLPAQCNLSNITLPDKFKKWVNIKNVYKNWETTAELDVTKGGKRNKSSRGGLGMEKMLKYLDMQLIGRHHSGIDDTRNIARMLIELCRRGASVQYSGASSVV